MSEAKYTVWVNDPEKDLNFDEFYDNFLNKNGGFEECYLNDESLISKENNPLRKKILGKFKQALEDESYSSSNIIPDRMFTTQLAEYIATIGIPVRIKSISGWDPQLIILSGYNKTVEKYLKNPDLDYEKRFDYGLEYINELGLIPRK